MKLAFTTVTTMKTLECSVPRQEEKKKEKGRKTVFKLFTHLDMINTQCAYILGGGGTVAIYSDCS